MTSEADSNVRPAWWEHGVCASCVTDTFLSADIGQWAEEDLNCSYCGQRPAAPFAALVEKVEAAIGVFYDDPAQEVPYESAEGGYQGNLENGADLVWEMRRWTDNDQLIEDVARELAAQDFARRHFFSLNRAEQLSFGWRDFVDQVEHRTRFFFMDVVGTGEPAEMDGIPPGLMLSALEELFKQFDLFGTLPRGTKLFRARVVNRAEVVEGVDELGAPPVTKARGNRMSPIGIPMFYAGMDVETAVVETFDPSRGRGKKIVVAFFECARDIQVLDLTVLPAIPSDFDSERVHDIQPISFLHGFVADLAKPVERDRDDHLEYIPTQVVTEFVRHKLRTSGDIHLDGILYRSSRKSGGVAVVLFADSTQCGPRQSSSFAEPDTLVTLKAAADHLPRTFRHLWSRP